MDLFSQIEEPEREELLALRKELEEANYKYYVLNMPTLSDREFDEKMHRLQELESQFPDMFDPKSPTQHVGSDLVESRKSKDKRLHFHLSDSRGGGFLWRI
jgi:DNA ligase (NAD+)